MKIRRSGRSTLWLALVGLVGGPCLPTSGSAQSPISLSVSPFLGAANFGGRAEMVPSPISTSGKIHLDAVAFIGLRGEVSHAGLPVRLRAGGARTVGGYLRAQQGSRTTSCGARCTRTEVLYGSVGDAAVTSVWTDAVLMPFEWKLRPYAFLGASYRWTSLSPQTNEIEELVRGSEGQLGARWGYGLELSVLGDKGLWMEIAQPIGGREGRMDDTASPGWRPGARSPSISLGMKLFVF